MFKQVHEHVSPFNMEWMGLMNSWITAPHQNQSFSGFESSKNGGVSSSMRPWKLPAGTWQRPPKDTKETHLPKPTRFLGLQPLSFRGCMAKIQQMVGRDISLTRGTWVRFFWVWEGLEGKKKTDFPWKLCASQLPKQSNITLPETNLAILQVLC